MPENKKLAKIIVDYGNLRRVFFIAYKEDFFQPSTNKRTAYSTTEHTQQEKFNLVHNCFLSTREVSA